MAHVTVEHIDAKAQAGWDDQQGFWGDDTLVAHADAVWRYGLDVRRGCGSVTPTPQTPQTAVLALLDACGGRGRVLDCDIPDWDAEPVPGTQIDPDDSDPISGPVEQLRSI